MPTALSPEKSLPDTNWIEGCVSPCSGTQRKGNVRRWSRYWATASEDATDWEDLTVCSSEPHILWISEKVINTVTWMDKALLGNWPVNTYHSNGCATLGRPLLGNAWVDTPDNNTWYAFLSSDVFSVGGPCRAYIWSSEDCSRRFVRKASFKAVQ
jgi:hypothetical protein